MTTMSISDCGRCGGNRQDIFQAKDPEDIKRHYDQLMASHCGKWSGEIYLQIMKTLNGTIREDQPNGHFAMSQYCRTTDVPTIRPIIDAKAGSNFSSRNSAPIERQYKKIFKNARNFESQICKSESKPGKLQESVLQRVNVVDRTPTPVTSSSKFSQFTISEAIVGTGFASRKCEVLGSGVNNYLVELREKSRTADSFDKISHSMSAPDRQPSTDSQVLQGDVGLFAHTTVDDLLRKNACVQAEEVKTAIGEPRVRLSIPDDEQSIYDVLENEAFRLKDEEVFGFEEKLPKWQRKFVVDKIEQSVGPDTDDESDIGTGETSFHSDNGPRDSGEKSRKVVSKPSRIPYVEEVRALNRRLFDKIASKWDRIAAQCLNHEDLSLTPHWSRLVGDVQLRSVDPFMGRILKNMKLGSRSKNAFVPAKYRAHAWQSRLRRKEEKDAETRAERKAVENFALTWKPVPKVTRDLLECCRNQTADKNGRDLLNELVEETARKAEAGYLSWEKDEIDEHYLKLCAIIKTKKRPGRETNAGRSRFF